MKNGAGAAGQKRGLEIQPPFGDCWIDQVMLRKYIEATKELQGDLKSRKEALVVSGGALDTERLEEDVQELFRYKDDGTVVHKWITDVQCDAFHGMAKVCGEDGLEDANMPQWTKNVLGKYWKTWRRASSTPKKSTWKRADFLRHVAGETEGRGAITFTCVGEHRKLFPGADFLWWVSTSHGERRKKKSMRGWWCGMCGQLYGWRKPSRLLTLQFGDTANEQVSFPCIWSARWRV